MKLWKTVFLAVVLLCTLVTVGGANAQTFQRGEIHGFVYDTSHAVVPGAKVTLSNSSTGFKREINAEQDGSYVFPQILPGVYQLSATASGFAATTVTDVNLSIGASLELDITLPVKGQTTSVTVSASDTGPIDTAAAGVNQVINERNLEDLPLNGRDYRDLAELSPSAELDRGLRGAVRLGGQVSDYSGLVIDGQDNFDNFFGEYFGSLETRNFTVPIDSVQEFQVVTNGYAPEFGRATGGLINVVTKSGTNELHGTAHYDARAGALTADDALHTPPNIDLQHQFGGTAGFPIHKNTQFMFLAGDFQREHGPLVTEFCTPGTNAVTGETQADCLAALGTATGPVFGNGPGQVPLPGAAQTKANEMLPPGCQAPTANESVLKACYGVNSLADFEGANNQFQNLYTVLGHWDWQLSPANHFSIRGNGTRNHTSGFTGGRGQNEIQAAFENTENFINQGLSGTFALNTVLGRKVNEIRVSVQGETRKRHPNEAGVPQIAISDPTVGNGLAVTIGQRYFLPINGDDGKLEVGDNFEYTFGKHDIKFGGSANAFVVRKNLFAGWSSGEWDFGNLMDFNSNTGTSFIQGFSATPGDPSSQILIKGTLFPSYQTDAGLYVQDKWQITPRFTLTYGVRWDGTWNPQPQTPFLGSIVPVGDGSRTFACFTNPSPQTCHSVPQRIPNDFSQYGPRVGFAWNVGSVEHPTIVRGAWGLYYAQSPVIFFPTGGGGRTTTDFGVAPPDGFPYLFASTPSLQAFPPAFTTVDPNFHNPRVSNFTAGVERTVARDLTVSATYVFTHSWHLRSGGFDEEVWQRNFTILGVDPQGRSILGPPIDPTIGATVNSLASFSRGNYHAVIANVTKRFSHHFQVFANYTWSQNKDNAVSERDMETFFSPQDPFNLNLDYGRNGLDVKHQFKAAGVYQLPWGLTTSAIVTAHSGVPYPIYVGGTGAANENGFTGDINGDQVANVSNGPSHNNDRPTVQLANGKIVLLSRYPLNQPGFADLDARLIKDIAFHERFHLQLQADFFNLTNRGNLFSNPDFTGTIDYGANGNCVPRTAANSPAGAVGFICGPLTVPLTSANFKTGMYAGVRSVDQIATLSTPFAFQAGAKFIF